MMWSGHGGSVKIDEESKKSSWLTSYNVYYGESNVAQHCSHQRATAKEIAIMRTELLSAEPSEKCLRLVSLQICRYPPTPLMGADMRMTEGPRAVGRIRDSLRGENE